MPPALVSTRKALLIMQAYIATSTSQKVFRILLGTFMVFAAIGHFTFQRQEFQAQVPGWTPFSKDFIVLASGIAEALLGLAMIFLKQYRVYVGIALALFFVLIFPGNIAQYVNGTDAFGLDTDLKRLVRLFFCISRCSLRGRCGRQAC